VRGCGGEGGAGGEGRDWGKVGEMTQTLYTHMNKIKIEKKKKENNITRHSRSWSSLQFSKTPYTALNLHI
jgi:hypothetical protein